MPKRTPPPPPIQATLWSRLSVQLNPARKREIFGLLLTLAGALTIVSLFGFAGVVTAYWANLLRQFAGLGAYVIGLALIAGGLALLRREENVFDEYPVAWERIVAFEILFAVCLGLLSLGIAPDDRSAAQLAEAGEAGGYLGYAVATIALRFLGPIVGTILLVLIGLIALRFLLDLGRFASVITNALEAIRPTPPEPLAPRARAVAPAAAAEPVAEKQPKAPPPPRVLAPPKPVREDGKKGEKSTAPSRLGTSPLAPIFGRRSTPAAPPQPVHDPLLAVPADKLKERAGHLPSLELLEESSEAKYAQSTAEEKKRIIQETLGHFGIPADVINYQAGPTITQFAVEPKFIERRGPDGQVIYRRKVPVNRILALSNDLALALAASPIRIEAPVPGRSYVGIEVPNETISLVSLRGVMESKEYEKMKGKTALPIALGRDVSGTPAVANLDAMPHLLIAGATGSGKSVCINAVIACMLFRHSPDTLRMIMVDPKRVELVNFNGIPHLLGQVITDVAQVVPALRWATGLMDARFQAFSKAGARNIESYNAKMDKTGGEKMSYVLIIIDELADLMLAAPEDTEKLITRLAQMARATGIHLVLATQRPSVDVVTGLIKANFPARISFAVTSSVDSRVVLDTPGAEKLLGRGDMLYMAPDSAKLARLQGCFVSDDELARLANHWRGLQEEFDFIKMGPWEGHGAAPAEEPNGSKDGDELIEKAADLILKSQTASISMLQRKLGIGYPRAARLMDQLEERGVVGPDEGGGKPRTILIQENGKKKK